MVVPVLLVVLPPCITGQSPALSFIIFGAIIEREVETPFGDDEYLVLYCNQNDFTTATAISDVINEQFGDGTATAVDGTSIAVMAPETLGARVSFLSLVENLEVIPGEPKASLQHK